MPDIVPQRRPPVSPRPGRPAAPISVGDALRRLTRPAGEGDDGAPPPAPADPGAAEDAAFWTRYRRVPVRLPDPPTAGMDVFWNGRAMPTYERSGDATCAAGLYVDLPAGYGNVRLVPRPFATDAGTLTWPPRSGWVTIPTPTPGAAGDEACPPLRWQSDAFADEATPAAPPAAEAMVRVPEIPLPAEAEIVGVGHVAINEARAFRSPQGHHRFVLTSGAQRVEVEADVGPSGVELKWAPSTAPLADPSLGTIAVEGAPAGVEFVLSRSDGTDVARFAAAANGLASAQVPPGNYKLRAEVATSRGGARVRSVAGDVDTVPYSTLADVAPGAPPPGAPPAPPPGAPPSTDQPPAPGCGPLATVPQGLSAPGTVCVGTRLRDNAGRVYNVVLRESDGALVAEPEEQGMNPLVKTLLVVAVAAGAIAAVAWYYSRDEGGSGSEPAPDADGARQNPVGSRERRRQRRELRRARRATGGA